MDGDASCGKPPPVPPRLSVLDKPRFKPLISPKAPNGDVSSEKPHPVPPRLSVLDKPRFKPLISPKAPNGDVSSEKPHPVPPRLSVLDKPRFKPLISPKAPNGDASCGKPPPVPPRLSVLDKPRFKPLISPKAPRSLPDSDATLDCIYGDLGDIEFGPICYDSGYLPRSSYRSEEDDSIYEIYETILGSAPGVSARNLMLAREKQKDKQSPRPDNRSTESGSTVDREHRDSLCKPETLEVSGSETHDVNGPEKHVSGSETQDVSESRTLDFSGLKTHDVVSGDISDISDSSGWTDSEWEDADYDDCSYDDGYLLPRSQTSDEDDSIAVTELDDGYLLPRSQTSDEDDSIAVTELDYVHPAWAIGSFIRKDSAPGVSARNLMLAQEKQKDKKSIAVSGSTVDSEYRESLCKPETLEVSGSETHDVKGPEKHVSGSETQDVSESRRLDFSGSKTHDVVSDTYEVELTWEGDSYLHNRKIKCPKHPGHREYIPVKEFHEQHLPPRYHHKLIVDVIRCLSTLTVRLTVDNISSNRPRPPYPPNPRQDSLGRDCSISGSGHVSDAFLYTEENQMPCPCKECVSSGNPRTSWGKIYIHTAAHVVHDDLEASHTTCSFFYDNDTDDLDKVIKISGMESVEINLKEDRCWMFCYTHDLALVRKLHAVAERYEKLQGEVRDKYYVDWYNVEDTDHKLTIIVSHPHGCGKYVSVGEFVDRLELTGDADWTQYTYTTPTCPGSSGAPVFILGKKGWFDYHHHSGVTKDTKLNKSTYGLF